MKQKQFCGLALILLVARSEIRARAQAFDPPNAAPVTAGTLYEALKSL